ncbi:MAG TPA: alanine--glyoxylate aminotransferase family protein [Anaerolineales bacterium]|jgi:alanine-glyoxylate transaminase/serine-glyoxylate transaminase/serine-pyruvate transaminase
MKNRKLLMIPGPIEFDPEVLAAMSVPTTSHVAPNFIDIFGQALEKTRQVFLADGSDWQGQPFILAGSGTLAMDSAAANLVEPGDKALQVVTGYFSDRFQVIMERYGAQVTRVAAPPGGRPELAEVEKWLREGFKILAVTHVDTSTGVINDIQALAELSHKYGALLLVDGVCSVAGEELRMAEWGVDLAFTASQKAIGVPPGLALLVAGPRAMEVFNKRQVPVMSYYSDWHNWLPVMQAYEDRKAAYFATPAVNLVNALNTSLTQILAEGLEARFARHQKIGRASRAALAALGLGQVPLKTGYAANTLSAPRYPQGMDGTKLLSAIGKQGVILAGGLHPAIRSEYFRIGHMGACTQGDLLATYGAVEQGLVECGYTPPASGIAALLKAW